MELTPCDGVARDHLIKMLSKIQDIASLNDKDKRVVEYVVKTFPNIMLDFARMLTEQATEDARKDCDPVLSLRRQLKPFIVFAYLLGKSPQITSLMYSYFENSSFQPLQVESFQVIQGQLTYTHPGFDDNVAKDILVTYHKFLSFNPSWFGSVWNWSELGRYISLHPNPELRYLATCCLSIITKPNRHQHMVLLQDAIPDSDTLVELQLRYSSLFENSFRPLVETMFERAREFIGIYGTSPTGYHFDSELLAKVENVLLLKRVINLEPKQQAKYEQILKSYIPVSSICDTISKIAYAASISKPCLIRGSTGSGKTAILDYIAAHTNRLNPPDYVKVQVGDQIDSKSLVGSYICTEIPGQFEWQPGPLTQAMSYGSWVVFEDIDSAPSEMAQVIHSVIENGNLSCVSCCPIKMDKPHPDFKIFFTQRTKDSFRQLNSGFGFIERLCDIIDLPALQDDDLQEILDKRYQFGSLTVTILKLYQVAREALLSIETSKARLITPRDLFKFCDRLKANPIKVMDERYSSKDIDSLLIDALECFAYSLRSEHIPAMAKSMGAVLNKPATEIEAILNKKPELHFGGTRISIGRIIMEPHKVPGEGSVSTDSRLTLAQTRQSSQLMETVAACINNREPVLLVGETGVGKTTIVQKLADMKNVRLEVINLSQQSDSSDLLGGYRPVDMREIMQPIHERFFELFGQTFNARDNQPFMSRAEGLFMSSKRCSDWLQYLRIIQWICTQDTVRGLLKERFENWKKLLDKVRNLITRLSDNESSPMALAFTDGTLLKAVREGRWILLDEINLAEPDLLQCLLSILDSMKETHVYMQTGGSERDCPVRLHSNFRIFACMNPSTDVGKLDLPIGVRGRFTEFFVNDVMEQDDLRLIVESYVGSCLPRPKIQSIVDFYREVRFRSNILSDISGNSPVYSLRTLCRALVICSQNVCRNIDRSLLESLKITFLQQLNNDSVFQVLKLIEQTIYKGTSLKQISDAPIPKPQDNHSYIEVEGFWVQTSNNKQIVDENYILTRSVRANLQRLCRILCLGQRKLPILIQGDTSVGKTSMIKYLAKLSGNQCYRINNHEHTDLQDYIGRYVLRENGELQFKEALLVTAMRKGYWVILDELNLAPSELLEALNRVLDDNRELFIPESGETIKAHPKFTLFATQNPPQEYAGRKFLSRAFRNRFIELHFDEIPHDELQEILQTRCKMAPQYAKKVVTVMKELQVYRRESGCFGGKNSFMTIRDLFRWGQRYLVYKDSISSSQFFDWNEHIAIEGLVLLEGRVRTISEANLVQEIIERVFKCKLKRQSIYNYSLPTEITEDTQFKHIHFTDEFKRLSVQLSRALMYKEPVLLCGQTGCGKTTVTQLHAALKKQKLFTYNCHLNSECSDFIGNVRPSRTSDENPRQTFPWHDGPLLQAMKEGALFLMDEISLADDAVLERINSVLESDRSITLTELNGEEIFANDNFRFVATMNPGGDYGKKELSPALQNRFTEIYCHNTLDIQQIVPIVEKSLVPALLKPKVLPNLIKVMRQFLSDYYENQDVISLRDVISWTKFLNKTTTIPVAPLSIQDALAHGACLVYFDQFGTCGHSTIHTLASSEFRNLLESKLSQLIASKFGPQPIFNDQLLCKTIISPANEIKNYVKFGKFVLRKGPKKIRPADDFIQDAPTVKKNVEKLARALQLDRPVLLEGDPGAGKTSIVSALAKLTGHQLVRINLSEQTDISDLFGSDLPDTTQMNDEKPRFCWHDGPMLRAIKESGWILLDEMNLASQSVLEGLNACFDHRGEIYIPELDKTFSVDRNSTRIFACQNPYSQGSARKGLPKSFLNRFTSIYIEAHQNEDLIVVLSKLYPNVPVDIIDKMIQFNNQVSDLYRSLGYEFNLRDLIYWCDLMTRYVRCDDLKPLEIMELHEPDRYVQFVYIDRMRTASDKNDICDIFERIFGYPIYEPSYRDLKLAEMSFIMTRAVLPRNTRLSPHLTDLCILKYQMPILESIAKAIEFNKMPILVGEVGVGKRSIVRILAGITGNKLEIVGANREMDTVELLGSYEQESVQRQIVDLVDDAVKFATALINSIPRNLQENCWTQLYEYTWFTTCVTSRRDLKLSKGDIMDAYRYQIAQMEKLIDFMQPFSISQTESKFKSWKNQIERLKKRILYQSESTYSSGNFEWIDSVLVKSIREGTWLMIENANLMNPATLDRLNSLVEIGGTLSINERGSGPGGIESLKPHPNFRLILTMDPDYGELSRAMRNRGVEIYVRTRFFYEDYLMLLHQNGFVPEAEKACMTYCIMQTSYDAHERITGEKPEEDGSLLAYFGLNNITNLANQVIRGVNVEKALSDLLLSFYHRKGHLENYNDESIRAFIIEQLNKYRSEYIVDLNDSRYKWCNFRHDLVSMTGGDAIPTTLVREAKILDEFSDPLATGLLKADELLESFDFVVACTSIKIFLELSTHNDIVYRRKIIRNRFSSWPTLLGVLDTNLDATVKELLPKIRCIINDDKLASSQLAPPSELYVDTRNSADFHFHLQAINYKGACEAEGLQNRWILALHRISLLMIMELVVENSHETPTAKSLYNMSEDVREGVMQREDLIRPQAEIAKDLYDLLYGLLQVVSNREYPNELVSKMMARTFWIGYILCKIRRAYGRVEHIALCNQLAMLWTLTYQKIIVPLIKDCELADLLYNGKKFSSRIEHICDFLDVIITKPSEGERERYNHVVNLHAATTKRTECLSREIDKFFNILIGRYTIRSERLEVGSDNESTLIASNLPWSNSNFMTSLYGASDLLRRVDLLESDSPEGISSAKLMLTEVRQIIVTKRAEYEEHEKKIKERRHYLKRCLTTHRWNSAMDQFAPVWQKRFMLARHSRLHPDIESVAAKQFGISLQNLLANVNGIIMSPRYASAVKKLLRVVNECSEQVGRADEPRDESINLSSTISRKKFDAYSAFLVDHLLENIVLDTHLVGWVKMRVNTSDLPTAAPLVPEYCPIISLVSSYCLDIGHLKLNSYQESSPQLDSMLMHLWRAYSLIKSNAGSQPHELVLAKNLIHLKQQSDNDRELMSDVKCQKPDNCCCLDEYISRHSTTVDGAIKLLKLKSDPEDAVLLTSAIKLIYYGLYSSFDYSPIFTLDPSLRSREKIEVYRSELAHVKSDLFQRNALHYWRTGENLRLVDMSMDEAKLYPMSIRALVERRDKLERSIRKLRKIFTNRPKSDDGTLYYELRKEVQVSNSRTVSSINVLLNDLTSYINIKKPLLKSRKISMLTTKCRMLIKTIERTIARFKSDFALYSDLTTNYLVGYCFIMQGLRLLYSRLEQKMQLMDRGFTHGIIERFSVDMMKVFSFNDFTLTNMDSVSSKRALYPMLNVICPEDLVSRMQSLILKASLLQLNHHILITPSDIEICIPIVRNIADKFHKAWLDRKKYLEEQRKKQEELYQYKTSNTGLNEVSYERQEFIDICTKFPLYDHIFQSGENVTIATSSDQDNLETEAKIINLNRSVDLTMCIDVCKAHYKFMKEASLNLLGQRESTESRGELRNMEMNQLIKIEAEVLYSIIRKCVVNFDESFDSMSIECHLLQANELIKMLRQKQSDQFQIGSLRNSIEILDEDIFDIYYNGCPHEVLKFKALLSKIDDKINSLRSNPTKGLEDDSALSQISKLTDRIAAFLITDPLMKFVTGAHALLSQLDDWNKTIRENRMIPEADSLVELIQDWRALEVKSWRSSLHRVKRKYIDDTLCDLWFTLHEAFNDPLKVTQQLLIESRMVAEDFQLEISEHLYQGFAFLIKHFLESASLGDYQIRLDLVFSFTIQTRFSKAYAKTSPLDGNQKIDFEKLTTYVYNIYRQYEGLMASHKIILEKEEKELLALLNNEIRIVNWQGRNLWEIKNNFRCSHRKLNKVMNRYVEVLRRPLPKSYPDVATIRKSIITELRDDQNSQKLNRIFERVQLLIDGTKPKQKKSCKLLSLKSADRAVKRMKKLSSEAQSSSKTRYVEVLSLIEDAFGNNANSISTFYSQRAQDLVIRPNDSKDTKKEKLKTCRQIYHTKKFAMQAIFKNLRDLGMSYQRGLNLSDYLDKSILSLEPLRGMIQNQSVSVLEAASRLIDEQLIISCNHMYRELMTSNQILLAQTRGEDLSGDQMERIRGYALEMVLDIIVHNKNAAMVYRHLMDIQAATTRLQQLESLCSGERVNVYNFAKVHNFMKRFNEIVSRAIASLAKLEMLMDCFRTYSNLQTIDQSGDTIGYLATVEKERKTLRDIINETDEKNSLITQEQYDHLQLHLLPARKSISEVCSALRNKLRHTIKNHLYGDDDIEQTQKLYVKFISALRELSPAPSQNTAKGSILGSLRSLLSEAEKSLEPILREDCFSSASDLIDLDQHSNIVKLDIRLQKLIKQAKLSAQEVYKSQKEFYEIEPFGEAAKRKMKPFNNIDSSSIRDILRPISVSKQVANCFMTLNFEKRCTNIKPIVVQLTPILSIYMQQFSLYLNVILHSLHLKLLTSNQLVPFFTDLVLNGFGLPCKIEDLEGCGQETSNVSENDDNAGFGEGEGKTDASKKLEFESQLDELKKEDDKKDKDEEESGKSPETGDIEAHEDGVEMSDDFDAKAEGANDEESREERDEEQSEIDEDRLNEVEKEFDEVDQDEAHLEQELWDDQDEDYLGEDDEEDLRQAQDEQLQKPDMDQKDLMAKNADLNSVNESAEDTRAENGDASTEDLQDQTIKEENCDESIDQSDTQMEFEDISDVDPNELSDINADAGNDNINEEFGEEEQNTDQIEGDVEEAENADADIDPENMDDQTDDQADKTAVCNDRSMTTESELEDENDKPDNRGSGKDSRGTKGDSALDDAEEDQDGDADDDQRALTASIKGEKKDQSEVDGSSDGMTEKEGDPDAEENTSGKRTFADRSSLDEATLKRQKIERASTSERKDERKGQADAQVESVRHVEKAKGDEIQVIDLASDDDELLLDDISEPEKIDQQGQASKLRSSDKKKEEESKKESDTVKPNNQSPDSNQHHQSSYNTNFGLLKFISHGGRFDEQKETKEIGELMEQIDNILTEKVSCDGHESVTTDKLTSLWVDCTRSTGHLVHELCQQLQIVLQPTKMSKYKGDYKSGKRLNMRKIVSYIASHYRKDKIWLRRTKPCKRTYNISLAVDNSSSMSENNCRQMTYQSLALLAKSLSLIEAGSLNVVSFGKQVKSIHEFDQPYVDAIGAQWLRELRFDESSTSYASVLRHSCESFGKQAQVSLSAHRQTGSSVSVNQLLIIISDGRNVTSESDDIKLHLRQLKSMGVLTLFVIIDDPKQNGGKSIVDIKKSLVRPGSPMVLESYMNSFPFPFYVLLRQIESMPSILGDALRQWFELVSNGA